MFVLEKIANPSPEEWKSIISSLPNPHILQTVEWAELKEINGWKPLFYIWKDSSSRIVAGVCIHRKKIPVLPMSLLYSPRGPLCDWQDMNICQVVLKDLVKIAREQNAIFLKIDPEVEIDVIPDGINSTTEVLKTIGWEYSNEQLQFRNTIFLDLSLETDELLSRFKQKTRYNIRLAEKKGVQIRQGMEEDLPFLYQMYAQTALRDGFAIRSRDYYLKVWSTLMNTGMAIPLIAEVNGVAVSAMIIFIFAERAYYFYGMSSGEYREWMPNHLLQWKAILLAKSMGCSVYDFWGAPDNFVESDPMYGVYRFKEGFNGRVFKSIGAWDYPVSRFLYTFYGHTLPLILNWMRRLGKKRIQREVNR